MWYNVWNGEYMKVKIKKLNEDVLIPTKANPGDAGFDLVATSRKLDRKGFIEFGTSLAFEIPEGHVGLIFPRSSISKYNEQLCNSVGVIDSSYRGEVSFRFKPSTAGKDTYQVGDKIGQLIIIPYPEIEFEEVDELGDTQRGEGGYGSSGN